MNNRMILSYFLICCLSNVYSENINRVAGDRGFEDKSAFAASLSSNPFTSEANDRTSNVEEIKLSKTRIELTRNSQEKWDFNLIKEPLLVRLTVGIWHKGTGESSPTSVVLNGNDVGSLNILWPSLKERNYVAFVFDKNNKIETAFDYQGWLSGSLIIKGEKFKVGNNEVILKTGIDQIKIKNLILECLNSLDSEDTLYDLRSTTSKTNNLPEGLNIVNPK